MKTITYEHFVDFRMPHTLKARGKDLYLCIRDADLEKNRYRDDLYRIREGKLTRLTALGDVGSYQLTDEGILFTASRTDREKEAAEAGLPKTNWYLLPYDGGEAVPFLSMDLFGGELTGIPGGGYLTTARESRALREAMVQAGGDLKKAAEIMKEEQDYHVVDEIPFTLNGAGWINGIRRRILCLKDGTPVPLTGEDEDAGLMHAVGGKALISVSRHEKGKMQLTDRLYLYDLATGEREDISLCDECSHYAAYLLPDGDVLALINTAEKHGLNQNPGLYLREGGIWKVVYNGGLMSFGNSVGSDVKAEGSECGSELPVKDDTFFTLDTVRDHTALTAISLKDGSIRRLGSGKANITSWDFFGEGFAVIAMEGPGGCEVWQMDENGNREQITHLNDAMCAEYEYSAPQELRFRNENGTEIIGWVIPPAGYDPEKSYPAILDIHGGPKTVYGPCYFHEMQLWASRGSFVLFCNPTGGDGEGDTFADIRGCYGDTDYRDIMRFTDEALKAWPAIDPGRLGVTGGSYGGFMTNWIIGHTDRFKAAASQRSISNWISFHNTSDIGFYFAPDQVGSDPWTDQEKIWAESPLKYADRVVTPTLFIHSDEDFRCPLSEGIQMFTALRDHGVEARMCIFKGENHELSRSGKPKHRVRRLKEITEWLEKYLKESAKEK